MNEKENLEIVIEREKNVTFSTKGKMKV